MPYYVTTQQATANGIEPVLPGVGADQIKNWAGTIMEDGRYLIWARRTCDISTQPLITIVTPRQAVGLTSRSAERELSTWFVP